MFGVYIQEQSEQLQVKGTQEGSNEEESTAKRLGWGLIRLKYIVGTVPPSPLLT